MLSICIPPSQGIVIFNYYYIFFYHAQAVIRYIFVQYVYTYYLIKKSNCHLVVIINSSLYHINYLSSNSIFYSHVSY